MSLSCIVDAFPGRRATQEQYIAVSSFPIAFIVPIAGRLFVRWGDPDWQGQQGSNLRIWESKSHAVPLGYAPTRLSSLCILLTTWINMKRSRGSRSGSVLHAVTERAKVSVLNPVCRSLLGKEVLGRQGDRPSAP